MKGNLIVGQSGGPTTVINGSLAGVIAEAKNHEKIQKIYGMQHGIEGLLKKNFLDLTDCSLNIINGLRVTPASALGGCRYKVKDDDYSQILEILKEKNIRYFFYIGGNDSMDTCNKISILAEKEGYEMQVLGIPKTIDNDLPITDHCPGFGSAARFTAISTASAGKDLEAMKSFDDVAINEIMGRHAGWLAAASVLAKNDFKDAPHLVYLPERAFSVEKFLEDVKSIHKELGYVFVSIGEGIKNSSGEFIGENQAETVVDAFGHKAIALGNGPASYLSKTIKENLGLQARYSRCGTIQRSFSECVSNIDYEEAYLVGVTAVKHAAEGKTGLMITLERTSNDPYKCCAGAVSLSKVANVEHFVPKEYINQQGNFVTQEFFTYCLPLAGKNIPKYVRLV
ncbi:MAG: hypothetical protein APF76_09585 [Desulfitibacter sp. BRH_c19]|nr:MAG: hypothetical protein APF76_09585 [Desulfitibacter sp. BRH_c19]